MTMERNPDKEKKPVVLTDDCDACDKKYRLTPRNAELHHHPAQPECDYMRCTCTHCGHGTMIFIKDTTFEQAVFNGFTPIIETEVADKTHTSFLEVNGLTPPEIYELTERQEALAHKFGEVIINMPDVMLAEGFSDETSRPYPERWI